MAATGRGKMVAMRDERAIAVRLREVLRAFIKSVNPPPLDYDDVLSAVKRGLEEGIREGDIVTGPDHTLMADALEVRVANLFRDCGFEVVAGRPKQEDFIVRPLPECSPRTSLVVEVKGGKAQAPDRDDLRQLDDWVFELSGEERARREPVIVTMLRSGTSVVMGRPHPTPHKGVLVFNGPTATPFDKRSRTGWVNTNEEEFARRRRFCLVALACLVEWRDACQQNPEERGRFWTALHSTHGTLDYPV